MKLEIHEENSGRYHWALTSDDGNSLASSTETFATYDVAMRAAEDVRDQTAELAIVVR